MIVVGDKNHFLQQNVSGSIVQVFSENGHLCLYVDGEPYIEAYTLEDIVDGYNNILACRHTMPISINDFFKVEL